MRRIQRLPFILVPVMLCLAAAAAAVPPALVWEAVRDRPGSPGDEALETIVAPDGAVYVAGTSYDGGVGGWRENVVLTRYDAGGTTAWTRDLATPGADLPGPLILDAAGNVILAAITAGDTTRVVTTKYDPQGTRLWRAHHDVIRSFGQNQPPRLAQGADGSLTLAAFDDDRLRLLRYDTDGTLLWSTQVPDSAAVNIYGMDVAVDGAGAAYVVGVSNAPDGMGLSARTFKVDAVGVLQWTHVENGNFNSFFEYAGVEVGPDGNPVVAANPESVCGLFEMRLWKLDAATGTQIWWNRLLDDEPCHVYEPVDMVLDGAGNAVVASFGRREGTSAHIQASRWNPQGDLLWYREFDGPGSSSDLAAAMAVDAAGAVYVAGLTTHPPQNRDMVAVKFDPDGTEAWSTAWGGSFGGNDWSTDIALGPAGRVAVVGTAYMGSPTGQDAVTLLYQQDIASAAPPAASAALVLQALGNPSDGPTDIRFALPRGGAYTLSVLDLRGREVRRIRQGSAQAGEHRAVWSGRDDAGRPLPSGAYLLRLSTPRGEAVRRMTLVR